MRFVSAYGFAGAFALGMARTGHDHVADTAWDGFGRANLEQNHARFGRHPPALIGPDDPAPQADVVVGNPPCSGFSLRTTHGDRGETAKVNDCMIRFVDYAAKTGAETVVMESVQNACRKGLGLMRRLRQRLEDHTGHGYALTHVLFDNHDLGAAQRRPRYLWIAHRNELTPAPPTPGHTIGQRLKGCKPGAMIDSPHAQRLVYAMQNLDWAPGERFRDVVKRALDEGHDFDWGPYDPKGSVRFGAYGDAWRADPARPCHVIYGRGDVLYCHWEEDRVLGINELGALMGYPHDWDWSAANTTAQAYTWVGKQVPVECGQWVGETLAKSEGSPRAARTETALVLKDGTWLKKAVDHG